MRQSASMAEIATEDGTQAEEEESAAEESQPKEDKQEEDDEGRPATESETSAGSSFSPTNLDSDSDTEDEEEEEEVVTNCSATASASAHLKQTPKIQTGVPQPLLSASHTPPSPSVLPSVIPGITVTETTPPPGTPPSPGRCISVSSPGRGRKIFMVTRVESPPEQQQQSVSAPPSQSQPSSPTPTQTLVQEGSPALPSDSQARVHGPSHTHTLQPQSADQPREEVNTSTLVPDQMNPSQQAPSQPSDPSPTQLTEEATEPVHGEAQHEEHLQAKEQVSADGTQGEADDGGAEKTTQVESQQLPTKSADEELVCVTEEIPSPNQSEVQQGAQHQLPETGPPSLTETSQEQLCPNQQNGMDEEAAGAAVAQREASSPPQSAVQESSPSAGGDSNPADPVAPENSPSSSADKGERSAEAVEDAVGSALPNGLKAQFSLHLLETESSKSGSCVMDHGESPPAPGSTHYLRGRFGVCVG